MAVEWARYGIQVNALAPGYFATDLNAEMRAVRGDHREGGEGQCVDLELP